MAISAQNLLNDFPNLVTWNRGPKETVFANMNSPQLANGESLIFVSDEKHLKQALQSKAKVMVVANKLLSAIPESEKRTILVSANPQLCMAKAAKKYFPVTDHWIPVDGHRLHPSAQIS